ncbi:hypothetical protein EDF62_2192 [Leucobacter luti]|uniref:Uncharacterized protein n=1 Tax=Leucobacter luti TaxID=340320 RepID=A0A4R6RXL1_9MICO|nr:hypothetical protein EDF62_2192 [Leucobacter luti]
MNRGHTPVDCSRRAGCALIWLSSNHNREITNCAAVAWWSARIEQWDEARGHIAGKHSREIRPNECLELLKAEWDEIRPADARLRTGPFRIS